MWLLSTSPRSGEDRCSAEDRYVTTKIRVVSDASALSGNNKALNALINSGPSLLPDLTGILLRFRENKFALQADIRKAFFMIGLREEDRPFLRFFMAERGRKDCRFASYKIVFWGELLTFCTHCGSVIPFF